VVRRGRSAISTSSAGRDLVELRAGMTSRCSENFDARRSNARMEAITLSRLLIENAHESVQPGQQFADVAFRARKNVALTL